jgi:hypothetical protein
MNYFMTWQHVVYALARETPGTVWRIAGTEIEHPRAAGLSLTFGAPLGQRASFRGRLDDGGVVCVEDYGDHYDAHIERPAPVIVPREPERASPDPAGLVLGFTAVGALFGLAFGNSRQSALTGALVGSVAGLSTVAVREAERSPATAGAAVEALQAAARILSSNSTRRLPRSTAAQVDVGRDTTAPVLSSRSSGRKSKPR